jgi:hypothetical protein
MIPDCQGLGVGAINTAARFVPSEAEAVYSVRSDV